MNKKIFRSSFIITSVVLLVSLGLMLGVLFKYFEQQILKELRSEAGYIAFAVENEGISYIDYFNNSDKRITIVDANGDVLADTLTEAENLNNHSDRKEIQEALAEGEGTSVRYSDTLMEKTVYYAMQLKDGTILRIAATRYSVIAVLLGLMPPLIGVVAIALFLSYLLSRRVSRIITGPIYNLDLEHPASNETYEELTPLLGKISSQRKTIDQQQRTAQQRQEEFKLITENMDEGFLVIDNQTNLLTCNQAAIRLLEIDEVKNDSVLMLNRTKGFRKVIETALAGERAESDMTVEDRQYNLIANPVFEGEMIIGAVIVILDITERVKREQLRREFTSNVSHELKTPLTSISGFAEIMKSGGTAEETVIDFSSAIYEEAQRLISLVNDIMELSELDEKNVPFEKEDVDLYELAREVIERLRPSADKKEISLNLTGESVYVMGVRKILDEILYNLCDNAIKYNKIKGTVDVMFRSTKRRIAVTVMDTGIGIPKGEQSRVFERFYRVDKSHSKEIGGTGLGLSIVKHGVIYHDAEINLVSEEGKGTSVTIYFNRK